MNAHRLRGKLLLVGRNWTPTWIRRARMQVVNALMKANKTFDFLVMPNEDHGGGRRGPSASYGDRKMWDFFVHNLLGAEPPQWNATSAAGDSDDDGGYEAVYGPSWESIRASFERKQ